MLTMTRQSRELGGKLSSRNALTSVVFVSVGSLTRVWSQVKWSEVTVLVLMFRVPQTAVRPTETLLRFRTNVTERSRDSPDSPPGQHLTRTSPEARADSRELSAGEHSAPVRSQTVKEVDRGFTAILVRAAEAECSILRLVRCLTHTVCEFCS